jgi:hypothetical protein
MAQPKPPITVTVHTVPFDKLSPMCSPASSSSPNRPPGAVAGIDGDVTGTTRWRTVRRGAKFSAARLTRIRYLEFL